MSARSCNGQLIALSKIQGKLRIKLEMIKFDQYIASTIPWKLYWAEEFFQVTRVKTLKKIMNINISFKSDCLCAHLLEGKIFFYKAFLFSMS